MGERTRKRPSAAGVPDSVKAHGQAAHHRTPAAVASFWHVRAFVSLQSPALCITGTNERMLCELLGSAQG
jgi:hypothetical protein